MAYLLDETRLVRAYAVLGVIAHDARLVAAMKIHGTENLLTFNVDDFRRFHGTEITVESPADIIRAHAAAG